MLWRWSEDSRLSALLDRRSAVVGTRWNEDIVGTNGLGTALETIQPVMINGSEHFSAALHEFTCAGAPIRHSVTRRVAGVLSVTSLVRDASPLMGPTLLKLAREVEEQLYSDSTLHERELLRHFLAERRRGRNAIVAVSEDVVIANKAGARLQVDHRALGIRWKAAFATAPRSSWNQPAIPAPSGCGRSSTPVPWSAWSLWPSRPSPGGRPSSGPRPPRSIPSAPGRPTGRSFPPSYRPRPPAATGCW